MTWLVLIWTALIVVWVNAERFAPAARLRHLWRKPLLRSHAEPTRRARTHHRAEAPSPGAKIQSELTRLMHGAAHPVPGPVDLVTRPARFERATFRSGGLIRSLAADRGIALDKAYVALPDAATSDAATRCARR